MTWLPDSDVTWSTASGDELGSMPQGNGDVAINTWVEHGGDLLMYVGTGSSWSENPDSLHPLLKIGRIRLHLVPNPFSDTAPFQETLHHASGELDINAGSGTAAVNMVIWVDANQPVVRIEIHAQQAETISATLETWRSDDGGDSSQPDRVIGYHRDATSDWAAHLQQQLLGNDLTLFRDPILNRTSGMAILGSGMARTSATTITTTTPETTCTVSVHALVAITPDIPTYLNALSSIVAQDDSGSIDAARTAHEAWWSSFWRRSYIHLTAIGADQTLVNSKQIYQRYMNACAGRSTMPIKFNGGPFVVHDSTYSGSDNADYRQWGGGYWVQNTRLIYWPMLASGDFDLMDPLFNTYFAAAPLCRAYCQARFGHGGLFFPETIQFWGSYNSYDYSTLDPYIWLHFNGSLELVMMMIQRYQYTGDGIFLQDRLLPLARDILTFWNLHWGRDGSGKLALTPVNSLETFWNVDDDTPDIAGLTATIQGLLAITDPAVTSSDRTTWQNLLSQVPPLPISGGKILPMASGSTSAHNTENPELYAVFPYRLYGVGKPDLATAVTTFNARQNTGNVGWTQDPIQAALLGLGSAAEAMILSRYQNVNPNYRYPGIYGPNYDYTPEYEQGNVAELALQFMLLQCDGTHINLMPAWPLGWDVAFKLHAPGQTVVEGAIAGGVLTALTVTPTSRIGDVAVYSAPAILLTQPLSGASSVSGSPITLRSHVFSNGSTVTSVTFLVDGVVVGSSSGPDFSMQWTPSRPGSVVVTAIAYDGSTMVATTPGGVAVTVTSATAPPPPASSQHSSGSWEHCGSGALAATLLISTFLAIRLFRARL